MKKVNFVEVQVKNPKIELLWFKEVDLVGSVCCGRKGQNCEAKSWRKGRCCVSGLRLEEDAIPCNATIAVVNRHV